MHPCQGRGALLERLSDRRDHSLHHPAEAAPAGMDQTAGQRVGEGDRQSGALAYIRTTCST